MNPRQTLESLADKLRPLGHWLAVSPLVVAVVAGVLFKIAAALAGVGVPMTLLIVALGAWILANYFFEILEHRASGYEVWPVLSVETLFSARGQLGVVFGAFVVAVLVLHHGIELLGLSGLARLVSLLAALLLPVSAAMLAVTRSPRRALDPARLVTAAVRMELGYVVILVASFGVWIVTSRAAASGALGWLLLAAYGQLLLAYVIGWVVYSHRGVLGVRVRRAPEERDLAAQAELERRRRAELAHAYEFASRGNLDGALAHLTAQAREEADPLGAEIWFFTQMTQWVDPRPAIELGGELEQRLAHAGREREAAKIATLREAALERARAARQASDA